MSTVGGDFFFFFSGPLNLLQTIKYVHIELKSPYGVVEVIYKTYMKYII